MNYLSALIGGGLIGLAVTLMLMANGRVAGVSGIVAGLATPSRGDIRWRLLFVVGLVSAGALAIIVKPSAFVGMSMAPDWALPVAGLLVGFGTVIGNGCTSGHGVCGISRFSTRSLIATVTFIGAGIATVAVIRLITPGGIS